MGIVVAHAAAGFAGGGGMGIADGLRDGRVVGRQGGVHRQDRGVALGGVGHVERGLGQGDAGLGPADLLHGTAGGLAEEEGLGIGVAHVLRGADHDAPGDEAGVLAARGSCG